MSKRQLSLDDSQSSPAKTPKKTKYQVSFKLEWLYDKDFCGVIEQSKDGKEFVWCKACDKNVKITAGGKNDIQVHFRSTKHKNNVTAKKQTQSMDSFVKLKPVENDAAELELIMCKMIAEHNVPPRISDHWTKMMKRCHPNLGFKVM